MEGTLERVERCHCSICDKKSYLHWIVPVARVRFVGEALKVSTYRFNTRVARHQFCSTCGVSPYYVPRSDPDKIDVNVNGLEGVDSTSLEVKPFDGQNWEQAFHASRGVEPASS